MAIEARARYMRHYGPGLADRLLTGVESAARIFGKLTGPLTPVGDLKVLRQAVEKVTGIAAQRDFIPFASRPLFKTARLRADRDAREILYFAGCYATYIRPEIGAAAIDVMQQMGLRVHLPEQHCCGLPMLSKGMIPEARRKIHQNLARWRELIDRVDHIVVTCSSCALSLTREWQDVDDSMMIRKVAEKTVLLSSLVNRYAARLSLVALPETVAYHSPCHLRVQADPGSSLEMLGRVPGLKTIALKSHCCGMAGTWGMAAENFKISEKLGNHLMRLDDWTAANWGVTDCPTCRIQMEQFGDKPIYHPIEIVAKCIE